MYCHFLINIENFKKTKISSYIFKKAEDSMSIVKILGLINNTEE